MAGVGLRPSHPQIRWRRFGDTILLLDHRRGTQQELQRRAGTGLDGSQHERECSGDGRKDKEIKEAEKEKERRLKMVEWMVKGKAALARVDGDFRKLKANELVALLRWYSVPAAEVGKKEDNFLVWMEMCGDDEPADVSWLDSDERKLEELRTKETEMVDTALGRLQERKKRELRAAIPTMSIAEILEIEAEIAEAKAAEPGAALVPI